MHVSSSVHRAMHATCLAAASVTPTNKNRSAQWQECVVAALDATIVHAPSATSSISHAPSATHHLACTIWHAPSGTYHLHASSILFHQAYSIRHAPSETLRDTRTITHDPSGRLTAIRSAPSAIISLAPSDTLLGPCSIGHWQEPSPRRSATQRIFSAACGKNSEPPTNEVPAQALCPHKPGT